MTYTVLRVSDEGVVLFDAHLQRLARGGPEAERAFRAFAAESAPGIYALTWDEHGLGSQLRTSTSLFEGIPVRFAPSPFAGAAHRILKSPPPNSYQPLRLPGIATILTSLGGDEIYESCTAAAVEWDGAGFVAPPPDRPCLEATSLRVLDEAGLLSRSPIWRQSAAPFALLNAVSGLTVPHLPGRSELPAQARALAAEAFRASTRRA